MPSPELRKRKPKYATAADTEESERGIQRKLPRRQAKASAASTPTAPGLIQQPTANDIILGRGVLHVTRVGNAKYYELLDAYMEAYEAATTKGGKTTIVRTIYQELSHRGVRFLKKAPDKAAAGAFCVIDAKQAKKKISHAIRYRKQNQQEIQEMQEKQQQQQQQQEKQTLLQEEDQDESGSGSGGSATGYQGEDSGGGSHNEEDDDEEDREGDDEGGSSPDDDEGGSSSQDDAAEAYDSSEPPPPPSSSFSPWNSKRNGSSATSSSCDADVIMPQRRGGGRAHNVKKAPPYSSSSISPSHMHPQASLSSTNTSSHPENSTGFSLPGDSSSTAGGGGIGSNASTASAAAAAAAAVDSLLRVGGEDPYSFPPLDAIVPYMNTMASWSAPSASSSSDDQQRRNAGQKLQRGNCRNTGPNATRNNNGTSSESAGLSSDDGQKLFSTRNKNGASSESAGLSSDDGQ